MVTMAASGLLYDWSENHGGLLVAVTDIMVTRWYKLRWRDWGPGIFLHGAPLVANFLQLGFAS